MTPIHLDYMTIAAATATTTTTAANADGRERNAEICRLLRVAIRRRKIGERFSTRGADTSFLRVDS